jgi:hypothetical protein
MTGRGGERVFVIDTSSILHVRRLMSEAPTTQVTAVYSQLIRLSKQGVLRFPRGVIDEIEAGAPAIKRTADPAGSWAAACHQDAVPHQELFAETRRVLDEVPQLLDVGKPSTTDEADPYVVALALKLVGEGFSVKVITEERLDTAAKISMTSACGLLDLSPISMRVFLARRAIWPPTP